MNKIVINYTDGTKNETNTISEKVGRKYADAVIQVFKHDGLIDSVDNIVMIDQDGKKTILYEKGKTDANRIDHCDSCSSCSRHPLDSHLLEGEQR